MENFLLNNDLIQKKLKDKKNTLPIITRFELAKIKAIRMSQLADGAIPFIETNETNIENIMNEEIKQNKLPFIIKRDLPNKNFDLWKLSDLIININ
jgi:DNA-directed RNA polymerases I, II, and III subunit RPABC2